MPRSSYKALPWWIQQVSVSTWQGWFCSRSKHWSWFDCCWTASCGAGQGTVIYAMPFRHAQMLLHLCARPNWWIVNTEEQNLNQFGAAIEIRYTKQCQVWQSLLHIYMDSFSVLSHVLTLMYELPVHWKLCIRIERCSWFV